MRKTVVVVLASVAVLLLLVGAFGGRRDAIARAQAAASRLRLQRDSLAGEVRRREAERVRFEHERAAHQSAADRLRDSVTVLERRRAEDRHAVRRLRTTGALLDRLRATFPEIGDSAWGLTTTYPRTATRPDPSGSGTPGLEYLMVPAWFAETFIIDRANAESWRAQKDRLLSVDSLRLRISALQDSVTGLVAANAAAYQAGYRAAYAGHQVLTSEYVAALRKPRFTLPAPVALVGAAAVGLVVGTVVR